MIIVAIGPFERKYKMNDRMIRLFTLCMTAILLLAGCASKEQPSIPVTGAEDASIPAMIEPARENVLEYIISSSRLTNAPPSAEWQLDKDEQLEGEYHFRSGDWLMVVWLADTDEKNQRVIISNKAENAFWCGYVRPDGHVVDTAYIR